MADSLAIRPLKTRPSTVATEKLAYFASNARLGSRIAIRSDSGDLSFKAGEVGADLESFIAEPVARRTQLLEDGRAGGSVSLDRECRAKGVDDGLPGLVLMGEDGARRAP